MKVGTVTRVDGTAVYVEPVRGVGTYELGPLEVTSGAVYAQGDRVLFAEIGDAPGEFVVLGPVGAPPPPAGDPDWIAPALLGGWGNYGGGFSIAGYRKDPAGFVHLRGIISAGVVGSTAFVLPVGYRPDHNGIFVAASNNTLGTVWIDLAGNVVPKVGQATWFSLDGIVLHADQ